MSIWAISISIAIDQFGYLEFDGWLSV